MSSDREQINDFGWNAYEFNGNCPVPLDA